MAMKVLLTEDDCKKAMQLHNKGYSWGSIANTFYISRKTMWRTLRLYGYTREETSKRANLNYSED